MANVYRYPFEPMGPGFFIFFRHEYYANRIDTPGAGASGAGAVGAVERRKRIMEENDNVMEIIKQGFPAMIKKYFD